jgi:hypothetical protein
MGLENIFFEARARLKQEALISNPSITNKTKQKFNLILKTSSEETEYRLFQL